MSRDADRAYKLAKEREVVLIEAHLEDGGRWLTERLHEVRAEKSRAKDPLAWAEWHAREVALMEEVATRQKRRGR